MLEKQRLLTGTALLTAAGLISRFIGFFYRIFLSQIIGAEGLGIYQLIFPIFTLSYSFTVMGMQTALSKSIASRLAVKDRCGAWKLLLSGTCSSFLLSLIVSVFLYLSAPWIGHYIFSEIRCIPLIRFAAFTIPFGTLHISFISWYFASRNTWIPSIAQLFEQIIRVFATWFLYFLCVRYNIEVTPLLPIGGMFVGEFFSFLFVSFFLKNELKEEKYPLFSLGIPRQELKELFTLSAPLTANRIIINLMRSIESILIPYTLKSFGLTVSEALSIYGTLTGMALPLLLFPSAITQSVSVMLLPEIAQATALDHHSNIRNIVEKTMRYGLYLGIYCFGIFYICRDSFGILLFHNQMAASLIGTLSFLCPFLYLSTTLSSIINGLGKTGFYFMQSICGLTFRIICILLFVPHFGINGVIAGMIGNEIILVLSSSYVLYREQLFSFSLCNSLLKPFCFMAISHGCSLFITQWIPFNAAFFIFILYCITAFCIYILLLFTFNLINLPKFPHGIHFFIDKK